MPVEPHFLHSDAAALADELFRPDAARLDEWLRVAVLTRLQAVIAEIAATVAPGVPAFERLREAGLLAEPMLVGELVDSAALARLGAGLFVAAGEDGEGPTLLPRLAGDPATAEPATALLVAGGAATPVLPAELHEYLTWAVAACMPDRAADATLAVVREALDAHDEGTRVEAAAMRLALRLDPNPAMVGEAIGARQIVLATALLARALAIPFEIARAVMIDPAADTLELALRAIDCPRSTLATIFAALAAADPRRDLEGFAERLDPLMQVDPEDARAQLAPLRLPESYRRARAMIERRT